MSPARGLSAPLWAAALSVAALALSTGPARAQFFNAVYSRDASDVIAVADSGALFRSTNGGATWTRAQLGNRPLRDVVAWDWNVVVVGDSGKVWRSADLGGNWALVVTGGTPSLKRIERLPGGKLIAVGSAGSVLQSLDGGATWSPQPSGTSEHLSSVRFLDDQQGWIAGTNGFLAKTANGGASWTPVVLGTANDLNCVDARGSTAWVVGDNATAFRSSNSGANWTQLNLHADDRPDVKAVWVESADTVFVTGGGGFIRRSVDGGNTWSFQQHGLQGQISDLYFIGRVGWAASSRLRAVMRTLNAGATWGLPAGAVTSRAWSNKLSVAGATRGNTIAINPFNKRVFYSVFANLVWRSQDEGETWSTIAVMPNGGATPKTNAFIVSPKDSNYWVAAYGIPDRIVWTDDAGTNWHEALVHDFGEYGIPIEMDPDHPDTLFFGGESGPTSAGTVLNPMWRSTDRGKTWAIYSDSLFRSPCDILKVPESDSTVIVVGDGITSTPPGRYWRGSNGSAAFTMQFTITSTEIPGLACSRLRNSVAFGTNWSAGGVQRSTNNGLTWTNVHTAGSAWGVDIARDDPDVVVFGTYGGTSGFLSLTGGDSGSFLNTGLPGINYGFYFRDRGLLIAEMINGMYKLSVTQTMPLTPQTVAVSSPNGAEVWQPGSAHDITWNAANLVLARIQYRRGPGDPWEVVAEVEGNRGRYPWIVPFDATAQARIQVSDAWDASPADSSDEDFTIPLALFAESPASLGYGSHAIGTATTTVVTVTNPGTAPLTVSAISTGTNAFHAGRASMSVPVGESDTLGVTFHPGATGAFADALTFTTNGYNAPEWQVPLYGAGMDTVALDLASPDGGEQWRYGTGQKIEWTSALVSAVDIEYQTGVLGPWVTIVENCPDAQKSYVWTIPATASNNCRVRIRQHGGGVEDASKDAFSITVPGFVWSGPQGTTNLDFGPAIVNEVKAKPLRALNTGTATLTINGITSNNPKFWPGRTTLVLEPGASDTVGFYYLPTTVGFDTATVTLFSNAPNSPRIMPASGRAETTLDVEGGTPTAFACWQNRPNPFTGRTAIRYALPMAAKVSLEVFNLQGQRVAVLVEEEQGPGEHSVSFGPGVRGVHAGLPSGIYFYRFRAGGFSTTHRMVMMK